MGHKSRAEARFDTEPEIQPLSNSYDSGCENRWEHWMAIRQLVVAVRRVVQEAD